MEKDYPLQITYLDSVDSTQIYLKSKINTKDIFAPHAVVANNQTAGVGSRDNKWEGYEGNLFLSFALKLDSLPNDLKLESASIYYAYILKMTLSNFGSNVQIKWPNDFYIEDKKIGGMITNITGDNLICGVGLNLKKSPTEFNILDIDIDKKKLLSEFFKNLEKNFSWKQIFSKYELEYYSNKLFYTYYNNNKIYLKDAVLQNDGSIVISNGERIYSRR